MDVDDDDDQSSSCTDEEVTLDDLLNRDDVDDSDIYERDNVVLDKFLDGEITFDQCLIQMEDLSGDGNIVDKFDETDNEYGDEEEENDYFRIDNSNNANDDKSILSNKITKPRRRTRALIPALQGMLGQASAKLLRGDRDGAKRDCLLVLEEKPQSAEPYRSMALIFDTIGESEKALQLRLIGAYLGPSNASEWLYLYRRYRRIGNFRQAVACISRAIFLDDTNVSLYAQRAILLKRIGRESLAVRGFLKLIRKLSSKSTENTRDENYSIGTIVYLCDVIGTYFYRKRRYTDVVKIASYLIERFPKRITYRIGHLYANALIDLGDYRKCFSFLCERLRTRNVVCGEDGTNFSVSNCELRIDRNTDIGLFAKLIICLIHADSYRLVDVYVGDLIARRPLAIVENHLFNIAKTCMIKSRFKTALHLLLTLVNDGSFYYRTLPDVWRKLHFCYEAVGDMSKALIILEKAVAVCRSSIRFRLMLSIRLKNRKQYEKALTILLRPDERNPLLLYQRCVLYDLLRMDDEFLECSYRFFEISFEQHGGGRIIKSTKELDMVHRLIKKERSLKLFHWTSSFDTGADDNNSKTDVNRSDDSIDELEDEYDKEIEKYDKEVEKYDKDEDDELKSLSIPADSEWCIFLMTARLLLKRKRVNQVRMLVFSTFTSNKLVRVKHKHIKVAAVVSCLYAGDYRRGFDLLCFFFVTRKLRTVRIWNLFNLFVTKVGPARANKFLVRTIEKRNDPDDDIYVSTLYANYCLRSGTYRFALNDYLNLYRDNRNKRDALTALQLVVVLVHITGQKHSTNKVPLTVQIMYYLKEYERLRGPSRMKQEIYYNVGRTYHQLGRLSDAEMFYKKCLETKPPPELPHFDLSAEAAFNLSLIYKSSDCEDLADYYTRKYIVT